MSAPPNNEPQKSAPQGHRPNRDLLDPLRTLIHPVKVAALYVSARVVYWVAHKNHRRLLGDYAEVVHEPQPSDSPNWAPIRATYRSFVRNAADVVSLLTAPTRRMTRRFSSADVSVISDALVNGTRNGGGVVLAFPHFGSFGAQAATLSLSGLPVTMVAKRQPLPIQQIIERMCKRAHVDLVVLEPGPDAGRRMMESCERALRQQQVVMIASDYYRGRPESRGGVEVHLAGKTRTVGVGPARLAMKASSPIVCCALLQEERGHQLLAAPVIFAGSDESVEQLSQRCADATTALIEHAPTQWYGSMISDPLGRSRTSRDRSLPNKVPEVVDNSNEVSGERPDAIQPASLPMRPEVSAKEGKVRSAPDLSANGGIGL